MFEMLFGLDAMVTAALAASWLIAGYGASRLMYQKSWNRLRGTARAVNAAVIAGTALLLGKLAVAGAYSSLGWWFAWDKWTLNVPIAAVPCLIALMLSYPRLRRLVRLQPSSLRDTGGRAVHAAADPRLVVPLQAAAVGALLSLVLVFFPASHPYLGKMAEMWAVLLGASALLAFRRILLRRQAEAGGGVTERGFAWRAARSAVLLVVLAAAGMYGFNRAQQASVLPDRYNMGMHHAADFGGGEPAAHGTPQHGDGAHDHAHAVSTADLRGPQTGEPDRRFTLTAKEVRLVLASGRTVEGWGFDGRVPGPELRVKQGDLVEVTLRNELRDAGVTIHWHGVNVPNGEDGVAGVTQDAVMPGESFTYRFIAEDAGTYWYHSHQQSSVQVLKGLYGALIVEPREESGDAENILDVTLMSHLWETDEGSIETLNLSDRWERLAAGPGTEVRLRLVNTSNLPQHFAIAGTPFRVTAIDGVDLNEPGELQDTRMLLAAGGRYTVRFTMPENAVFVQLSSAGGAGTYNLPGVVLSPDGNAEGPPEGERLSGITGEFDPAAYGSPADTPFGPESHFHREFVLYLDSIPGFYDGQFHYLWTINGRVFPNVPTLMVREGERIKTTFVNRSFMDHPMHLHGHHMLVLSRNGKQMTGSPWWTDTLNVAPGESFEVAFLADNPGIWMDHCHNLDHAAIGMTLHLAYEGVSTPFEAGRGSGNLPE